MEAARNRRGELSADSIENDSENSDGILPLYLQDLCLLKVVNDLDGYPVDLLASLPRWLRYRLLNSLPDIDLCRLDHTPIAKDIEVDQLWRTRLQDLVSKYPRRIRVQTRVTKPSVDGGQATIQQDVTPLSQFDLNVSTGFNVSNMRRRIRCGLALRMAALRNQSPTFSAKAGLDLALEQLKEESRTCESNTPSRRRYLLEIMGNLLSHVDHSFIVRATSINGAKLLQNLASHESTSITDRASNNVWKKQATALKMNLHRGTVSVRRVSSEPSTLLSPFRLQSLKEGGVMKLISFLVNYCPQPASINLHVNAMSTQIHHALYGGKFAQDNGYKLSTRSKMCIASMNHLLGKAKILKLGCDDYSSIGIMTSMIEAAMSEGSECKLMCLYCSLPDLYTDVLTPLSSVFSLPNFRYLILDLNAFYIPNLSKILVAFLTAPCSHKHQLTIQVDREIQLIDELDVADLATFNMGVVTIPQCAIEHKVLHSTKCGAAVLHVLLQLPTVRLNELHINSLKHIHLCSLHPDLKAMKLFINVDMTVTDQDSLTCREDLVRLLKMPTLREISICGRWLSCNNFKVGVIEGFHTRAQSSLPLRIITLQSYTDLANQDYRPLWNAIFSLPRLELTTINLWKGFANAKLIHESWVETAKGVRLKSLCINLKSPGMDSDLLSPIAHELSQ